MEPINYRNRTDEPFLKKYRLVISLLTAGALTTTGVGVAFAHSHGHRPTSANQSNKSDDSTDHNKPTQAPSAHVFSPKQCISAKSESPNPLAIKPIITAHEADHDAVDKKYRPHDRDQDESAERTSKSRQSDKSRGDQRRGGRSCAPVPGQPSAANTATSAPQPSKTVVAPKPGTTATTAAPKPTATRTTVAPKPTATTTPTAS